MSARAKLGTRALVVTLLAVSLIGLILLPFLWHATTSQSENASNRDSHPTLESPAVLSGDVTTGLGFRESDVKHERSVVAAESSHFRLSPAAVSGQLKSDPAVMGSRLDSSMESQKTSAKVNATLEAIGSPVIISGDLPGNQHRPIIRTDSAGNSIVVWQGQASVGQKFDIFCSIVEPSGLIMRAPFRVNSFTSGDQIMPALGVGPSREFVVAWTSLKQDAGGAEGVYAQRFAPGGEPLGNEQSLHIFDTGNQSEPALAITSDGTLWATWTSYHKFDASDILLRHFGREGEPLTDEVLVNSFTQFNQSTSSITLLSDEKLVAVFQGENDGSALYDIYLRFIKKGIPQGSDALVNTHRQSGTWGKRQPTIASNGRDRFVVVWGDNHDHTPQDGNGWGVFGQMFNSNGGRIGSEFRVNETTRGFQGNPTVTMAPNGEFFVVWSNKDGTDRTGVFLRHFQNDSQPKSPEMPIAIERDGCETDIQYCGVDYDLANNSVAVVWSQESSGRNFQIAFNRFRHLAQ